MREPKTVTMKEWSKKDLIDSWEEATAMKDRLHAANVELREQNQQLADLVVRLKKEAADLAKERYDLAIQLAEAHKAIVKLVLGTTS